MLRLLPCPFLSNIYGKMCTSEFSSGRPSVLPVCPLADEVRSKSQFVPRFVRVGHAPFLTVPHFGVCNTTCSGLKTASRRSNALVAMHFYTPLLTVLSTFPELGESASDQKSVQISAAQKRSDILGILFAGLTEDEATRLCLPMPPQPDVDCDDDIYDDRIIKCEAWLLDAQPLAKVCSCCVRRREKETVWPSAGSPIHVNAPIFFRRAQQHQMSFLLFRITILVFCIVLGARMGR